MRAKGNHGMYTLFVFDIETNEMIQMLGGCNSTQISETLGQIDLSKHYFNIVLDRTSDFVQTENGWKFDPLIKL